MVPLRYNLRSLTVRRTTTIAAAGGVALVVFVLASTLMLRAGIQRTLDSSGKPEDAIVMSVGAVAELGGLVDESKVPIVLAAPGVKHDDRGRPVGVAEVVVVGAMEKRGRAGLTNVSWRGVQEDATGFRPEARIVAGRPARPGTDEAIVGVAIRGRIEGLDLGQTFRIESRPVTVVGVFAAAGESYESEVWMDRDLLRQAFHREGTVSSVRVRLNSPDALDVFRASVEDDKRLELRVMRETTYYEKMSEGAATVVGAMGTFVASLLALGAGLGAVITMHAAVAYRTKEIGVLRALGFSPASVVASFLFESVLLAAAGGALGVALSFAMSAVRFATVNFASFSETVVSFQPTLGGTVTSFLFACALGLLGGVLPAVRAAGISPLEAARG